MTKKAGTDNASLSGVLPVGARLGKYEIVERLGSGGEAIVYKGYDSLLDRYVAIKQVAVQLAADEKFTMRFRDVAKRLANLGCEQIVTIYELIEQQGGLFVIMEHVEGRTIETMLSKYPDGLEPNAVLRIIWRIAAGLAAIHDAGIIHRDIKPGNIIVAKGLKVKITDFGVAARIGGGASMKLGTTRYMAPELFAGQQVDGRADIYSLGMIAYEMLAGRKKFNEIFHDVVRDPHSEALRWMKWHSTPEISAPALNEVNPGVPEALAEMVARMLAKDPDERFADVEELGKRIRSSFSPRPHVSGETGFSEPGAGRLESPGGVAPEPGGQAETAGALTGQQSEPITAPIPSAPMSLRKKLAIAGVAAGVILAGLLAWLIVAGAQRRNIRERAQADYGRARSMYNTAAAARTSAQRKSMFSEAAGAFGQVAGKYGQYAEASQAKVMERLSRAYVSVAERNWDGAIDESTTAGKFNTDLQRRWGDRKESKEIDQEIKGFDEYWNSRRQYAGILERVRTEAVEGSLEQADKILREEAGKYAVTDEQVAEVQALQWDIRRKQKTREYWSHVRRADELAAAGDIPGGLAAMDKAVAVLESAKEILAPKIYEELKKAAEDKTTALNVKTKYDEAIAEAKTAQGQNRLLAAADAYEKAHAIRPDETLLAKARDLRHDYHLQQAMGHMDAERFDQAAEELRQARSFKDSPEVAAQMEKLQRLTEYGSLVGQGDGLFEKKDYKAALARYIAAEKLSAGEAIKGKIVDCRYNIEIAAADAYRAKAQWQEATQAYNRARQIKPDASAEVDVRLDLLEQDRAYAGHISAAKAALQKADWSEALTRAQKAREIRPTAEADRLISLIRYEQVVALGQEAMDRDDYNSALAYFKQAKRFLDTPEIDELIEKARKLKQEAGTE